MAQIEAVRVVQDAAYAASLSDQDWYALAQDPAWQEMVSEQSEMVAGVIAQYGNKLPGGGQSSAPTEIPVFRPFQVIGTDVARIQGYGIVTNTGTYTENLRMPGMLFMRTLRSRYPHAKIKAIDTSEAEKIPGVRKILHRGNLPEEYKDVFLGSALPTRFLFNEEVFEVGSPIAVIAADSEHIGDVAIRAIKVEYEVLPAALDMLEAMKSSTPKQFTSNLDGTTIAVTAPLVRGDPTTAKADVVVDNVARKSTEQHVALELTNSLSYWDGDKLNMTYTNQHGHGTRSGLSQALKLPQNKVRVFQTGYLGSGYGYRSGIDLSEVHAAILSKITGRPIKNNYTRYEDFVTRTHRPEFRNEMKLGVNRDGTISFGIFKVIANVGAQRAGAANGAWVNMQDLYTIPNLRLEAVDVMTNSYKSGPYRCVSHPNGTFALETTMEKAAYAIGMDPVEFRLKNLNEVGNPDTGKAFSNPGLRDCITMAADRIGWKQKFHAAKAKEVSPGVYHGIGLAAHACSHGAGGQPATGTLLLNPDGSIEAVSGSTEIGGGERTQMRMIAAEAMGVDYESVSISASVDTDTTTDTGVSGGSQQTNSGGWGMYEAAIDARRQLFEIGARMFTGQVRRDNPNAAAVAADQLTITEGKWVSSKADSNLKAKISQVVTFGGGAVIGRGVHLQDPRWERTAWAAHAAEVEVDTVTGEVKVVSYVAAHDIGRIINRMGLEQQIEGGVVMSLGSTLYEELLTDKATGLPLNGNLLDYRIPSIKDVPEKIDVILIERPKEYGVYGAHGIGEPAMGPEGPTIANAVHNATGIWFTELPITRERVVATVKGSA